MAGGLLPLVLLVIVSVSHGTVTEFVVTPAIDLSTAAAGEPVCVGFNGTTQYVNDGLVVGAFDMLALRGLLFPCSANLSVWLEMDGLPPCAFISGDPGTEVFIYPGDPCNELDGDYFFSYQGSSFQDAVCSSTSQVPSGLYMPQGFSPTVPTNCGAITTIAAPFSRFAGLPYSLTLKLCMMHTMSGTYAPLKLGMFALSFECLVATRRAGVIVSFYQGLLVVGSNFQSDDRLNSSSSCECHQWHQCCRSHHLPGAARHHVAHVQYR